MSLSLESGYFKIMMIGDPHFMEGFLDELRVAVSELNAHITDDLDFVVIMGDLLDNHDKIDLHCKREVDIFIIELSKRVKKVYVLIGNHDRPIESDFLTDNHVFNLLKISTNVVVVDKVVEEYIKCERNGLYYKFIFAPYVSPERFYEACSISNIFPPFDDIAYSFSHQEFKNYSLSKLKGGNADEWMPWYPGMACGHIHTYDETEDNLLYVGSFIQTKFSDTVDKSISVITIEPPNKIAKENYVLPNQEYLSDKNINRNYLTNHKRIRLNVPRRFTIRINPEEFKEYIMPENCKIKIYVECGQNVFNELKKLDKFKELETQGATIVNTDTNKIQYVSTREFTPSLLDNSLDKLPIKIKFHTRIENRIEKEPKFKELYENLFKK